MTENLKTAKYLIIDTETTGLSPLKHGLIQVAAAALDNNFEIMASFVTDICPPKGYEITQESMEITGFTLERIEAGVSYGDFCQQFLDFISANFQQKAIPVGQFFPFDFAFLDMVFTKVMPEARFFENVVSRDFLDTKSMVATLNMLADSQGREKPFENTSLSKPGGLKDKLGITGDFKSHDALGDVLATREVLVKLVEWFRK